MRGMGRLWQAAGTVNAVLAPGLLEQAVDAGLRSLFVGFETLNPANLVEQRKYQNLRRDYAAAIRRLHDLGVMINGSFVFGMDGDDGSVFERTVEWAIEQGIETATFHILTPYPGTALYQRMAEQGRHHDRRLGSATTRATPSSGRRGCRPSELEGGYRLGLPRLLPLALDRARRRGARRRARPGCATSRTRPGWKKFEPLWDLVIRAKRAGMMLPVLETILSEFGRRGRAPPGEWTATACARSLRPTAPPGASLDCYCRPSRMALSSRCAFGCAERHPCSGCRSSVFVPSRYFTNTTSLRFSL